MYTDSHLLPTEYEEAVCHFYHMGREELGVKWENTDRVDALKAAVAE